MTRVFLDTNLLVYPHDDGVPAKRDRAKEILKALDDSSTYKAVVSHQVLQEFYNALTRKLGIPPVEAKKKLLVVIKIDAVTVTTEILLKAVDLHMMASISFWDALIVSAAQAADCEECWTEDLQDGQKFGKLRVVNPFKRPPASAPAT